MSLKLRWVFHRIWTQYIRRKEAQCNDRLASWLHYPVNHCCWYISSKTIFVWITAKTVFHNVLTPSYFAAMTSSCVSKTMLELQHIPTGFGWMRHLLPVPCCTQQAASLQYLDVPFQDQSFSITPSQEWSKHKTDSRAITWLLGLRFHTCDTSVFVSESYSDWSMLSSSKTRNCQKVPAATLSRLFSLFFPSNSSPTQLRVIQCAGIVQDKDFSCRFYRKRPVLNQAVIVKDRMHKLVTGIKASDRSVGPCNLMLAYLALPVTAILLCSQRKVQCCAWHSPCHCL